MNSEELKQIVSNFATIVESPFKNRFGATIGWHSTCVDSENRPLGSGFSENLDQARRVAVAETIERSVFREMMNTMPLGYGLESNLNTDGFACGFENSPTMLRALCEAIERWIWSKWIDEGYRIEAVAQPTGLNPLQHNMLSMFDEVLFYQHEVKMLVHEKIITFYFGVTIARKGSGVFPGSRVSLDVNSIWQHSLIEALRNYNIFINDSGRNDIICARIKHFGMNGSSGILQVQAATKSNWPAPRLKILKQVKQNRGTYFMWRALCDSYMDWHTGPVERFVY